MSITVDSNKLFLLIQEIFETSGLTHSEAYTVAESLLQAEMRNIRSHGLVQTANYSRFIQEGKFKSKADIKLISESPSTLAFDADHAPGAVAGKYAMAKTIEKAKKSGAAISTVKNGTHFGYAAYFAMDALPENFIGLAFTSTGPVVAPFGGFERLLGTNPICVAVPAGKERPVVFDAATSNQAYNKIFFAYTEGRQIPDDWGLNKDGNTTTNPKDIVEDKGALLPFGGYKGYGLSFIVFILTTLLSGTSVQESSQDKVSENTRKISYNFAAIDISKFTDVESFKANLDYSINQIKQSRKRPGVEEIFVPGEIEFNNYEKAHREGLLIYDGVEKMINETLAKLNINKSLNDIRV